MTELQETSDVPVIVHQGRYRLYQNPDGGLRIQYLRDDKDEEDYVAFPGPMVALAKAASEGKISPVELMKRVMAFAKHPS